MSDSETPQKPSHFIQNIIEADLAANKNDGTVITRFPPEPNGFLHLGHAKSICINFGLAEQYQGACNLRFDDTNPEKESQVFIDAIKKDVDWLGFEWQGDIKYASDYFQLLYECAVELVKRGKAYVCGLNAEETREYRGTLTKPGKDSPGRSRSPEENLDLFERMRKGEFADGEFALRAKIDMASPNINMRDPVIYRIRHVHHHQTGDQWCIYPMYDFTHCLSDAFEGVTHSLCSLEFEDHRPLYDWFVDQLEEGTAVSDKIVRHPQQIEFARLNVNYTLTSKRKLKALIDEQRVSGWDDPRMPTLSGMRRRGFGAGAIRNFCERVGVTKSDSVVDMGVLEFCVREELDSTAPRAMGVLRPLKVVITNYPEEQTESLTLPNHPKDESMGQRVVNFERELYIDQNDFSEVPPPKYKRLKPGGEVRLRGAYVIRCDEIIKDDAGEVIELRCHYDDQTLGKKPEGRSVKGVVHWVPASESFAAEVRLYDRLFDVENPEEGDDLEANINQRSLDVLSECRLEASLKTAEVAQVYQFEREGYFCLDESATEDQPIFNRTITLRDSWEKLQNK